MAKDIAALSSDDKTTFKAALAGMGYMTPISSVAISSPRASADIVLPIGYSSFQLIISGMRRVGNNPVCAAFSSDGGATIFNSPDDANIYDGYCGGIGNTSIDNAGSGLSSNMKLGNYIWDGYFPIVDNQPFGFGARLNIDPGDGTLPASLYGTSLGTLSNAGHPVSHSMGWVIVNGTGFAARMNLIRIAGHNSGDMSNPIAGDITAGVFSLFGIPTTP